MRPSRHGMPPPVAITSPDLSLRLSSVSASSWRNRASPAARKISGIERPSAAVIMSSVSTKQRPRRRASKSPHTGLPAPLYPPQHPRIVSDRLHTGGELDSAVHGSGRRGPAVGAVAHPAPGALAEIVVDPGPRAGGGQQGDRLHRRHEAGLVEPDADRIAGADGEERLLFGDVPMAVPGADP